MGGIKKIWLGILIKYSLPLFDVKNIIKWWKPSIWLLLTYYAKYAIFTEK